MKYEICTFNGLKVMAKVKVFVYASNADADTRAETNIIYHHTVEGTRESHPSVHDLQSTTRLAESWMLQIMDTRMGFPCPFHSVVIDYFSPTPFIFNK